MPKQLVIIKIPEHAKAAIMEAKGNLSADAAASQEVLTNSQTIQTQECFLLPSNKVIKDSVVCFQQTATEAEKRI